QKQLQNVVDYIPSGTMVSVNGKSGRTIKLLWAGSRSFGDFALSWTSCAVSMKNAPAEPETRNRPFITAITCSWRWLELYHEKDWFGPLRRRFPGKSISSRPAPVSTRCRHFVPGNPYHIRVRRQHHRRARRAQLGPLQQLGQRVRRRGI